MLLRALSAGCSNLFSSHLLAQKRPQRRGSDWSRLFIGRARGIATPGRTYQVWLSAFVPTRVSASLGTGCRIGERPGTISDRSPCQTWSARMFNPLMMLAGEASGVIALRMMKMMRGGRTARREANLMVSEKIKAAIEATASLAAGASGDDVVHRYRQHVKKNAKRLSGRSRNRVLEQTRRQRK